MNRQFLGVVSIVLAQALLGNAKQTESAVVHFHWSERLAHELDYKSTISKARTLSPDERSDLLAFVLTRFEHPTNKQDELMFEGVDGREMRKLAANTRIEFVDLNGDGRDEVIAQGNGLGPCGWHGQLHCHGVAEHLEGMEDAPRHIRAISRRLREDSTTGYFFKWIP